MSHVAAARPASLAASARRRREPCRAASRGARGALTMATLQQEEVVICGGGIVGAAIAYHLTLRGTPAYSSTASGAQGAAQSGTAQRAPDSAACLQV